MFDIVENITIGVLIGNFIVYVLSSIIFIFILDQIFQAVKIKKIK